MSIPIDCIKMFIDKFVVAVMVVNGSEGMLLLLQVGEGSWGWVIGDVGLYVKSMVTRL